MYIESLILNEFVFNLVRQNIATYDSSSRLKFEVVKFISLVMMFLKHTNDILQFSLKVLPV